MLVDCLILYILSNFSYNYLIRNVCEWVKTTIDPIVISTEWRVLIGVSGRLLPSNPLSTNTCTYHNNYELVSGLTIIIATDLIY